MKKGRMPTLEQILLSTADGDVFAILESYSVLVEIFTWVYSGNNKRAKINMMTSTVTAMIKEEVTDWLEKMLCIGSVGETCALVVLPNIWKGPIGQQYLRCGIPFKFVRLLAQA